MGFDIECIVDINTYPGEYFCPVCRTLVYPNEALQAQCTHLYCKPCLVHTANGSRACPYDGYLVTEADSKLLTESDKVLAEKIGKVKVRCLYCRSGCTWTGFLSECTSHCSTCAFGNSPVICNRCGVQILHRQVHDHAQSCPGVYQVQQPTEGVKNVATSGTATTTTDQNQTTLPGTQTSNTPNPLVKAAAPLAGQDANQQANANSVAKPAAGASMVAPDQWYQQQYQQYYQQYGGYDPYQQPYQQFYNYQQPVQQYQQYPTNLQAQQQPQVFGQPQIPQRTQSLPLAHSQNAVQPSTQVQPQSQTQAQPQLQISAHNQNQVPTPGQSQPLVPTQSAIHPFQNQSQVNPQQQLTPAVESQAQISSQTLPTPQNQPALAQPSAHVQTHPQPPPMQHHVPHAQLPQYQQPYSHPQPSQVPVQAPMHPHSQPQPQSHLQIHPQTHLQPPVQSNMLHRPPTSNAATVAAVPSQTPYLSAPSVSGYHSYPQPPLSQKMQLGVSQQHPVQPYPLSGSVPSLQMHGHAPQQPALVRPPQSHGPVPQQMQAPALPPPQGVPPAQQQQYPHHAQQSAPSFQQRPVMQPVQHGGPPQYMQQHPFPGPPQSQFHQQGHFPQQLQLQSHVRPQGPPHMMQQNIGLPPGAPPQQPQNYIGSTVPNSGMQSEPFLKSSAGFGSTSHIIPAQQGSNQLSTSQNLANRSGNQLQMYTDQEHMATKSTPMDKQSDQTSERTAAAKVTRSPSQNNAGKDVYVGGSSVRNESLKSEAGLDTDLENTRDHFEESGRLETVHKDADTEGYPQLKHIVREESTGSSLEQSSGAKGEISADAPRDENGSAVDDSSLLQTESLESQKLLSSKAPGVSLTDIAPRHPLPAQGPPFPTPRSFKLQSTLQGPPPAAVPHGPFDPQSGIMGRAPPFPPEDQLGSARPVKPTGAGTFHNQRPDGLNISWPLERGPSGHPSGTGPNLFRVNGPNAPGASTVGSRNEKIEAVAREHLDHFPMEPNRPLDHGAPARFLPPYHPTNVMSSEGGERELSFGYDGYRGRPDPIPGNPEFPGPGPDYGPHHMRRLNRGPGYPWRDDIDGPVSMRFGDHLPPGPPFNHPSSGLGQDLGPNHFRRGEFMGPGNFPGHLHTREPAGFDSFPGNARGKSIISHLDEPDFRSRYSLHRYPDDGPFAGEMDSSDMSRKRKLVSMGWCRICEIDCETVDGLDLHSQTREHQKMAMDIVRSIKQQNRKKQRTSGGRSTTEEGGKARNAVFEGRGGKP